MSRMEFQEQVNQDFDRARTREIFGKIIALIKNEENELFSFYDVKSILRPKSSTYKGVQAVKLSHIIGSEGRYNDFNKLFLPKSSHLRSRWASVNSAHYSDVILPPIRVYELGGVYFVRDGNHRVSVAKMQQREYIDAEIIELNAEIKLDPAMSREDIVHAVITFEKRRFLKFTRLDKFRPDFEMDFSNIGRYDDIINHIEGHKYYLNLDKEYEIPFQKAMLSWYDTVYLPIINIIREEKILHRFPGRTLADLYVWICRMWDHLKQRYGQNFPLQKAVEYFSRKYGKTLFQNMKEFLIKLVKKLRK